MGDDTRPIFRETRRRTVGQGTPARPPKPIKGVGRHADRVYCPSCGRKWKDCGCGSRA